MIDKKITRLRRAKRTRSQIKTLKAIRLCVHRTPKNIYAQLLDPNGSVLVVASTLDKEIRKKLKYGGNTAAAKVVGEYIATRGKEKGIVKVAFDRSGFKYHGRILALAQAAREHGLEF